MKRKKLMVILVAVILAGAACAAVFLLKDRGDSAEDRKEIDPPTSYRIGGVDVAALPVLSEEITVYQEAVKQETQDGEETEETEEKPSESDTVVYRYEGFEATGSLVEAYVVLMNTVDTGFCIVDDTLAETEAPDYEAEEGSVHLARNGAEEGKVMSIQMAWSQGCCTVTVETLTGEITEPPVPEAMTISEAEDYVRSMSPARLGLAGTSMQEYNIYVIDGTVLVDGIPCIRLNVYRDDGKAETNEVVGIYFLSADKAHIYKLDVKRGVAEEVS